MDENGAWRHPSDWPGELPPIENWVKGEDGRWMAPPQASVKVDAVVFEPEETSAPQRAEVTYPRRRPIAEGSTPRVKTQTEGAIPEREKPSKRSSNGAESPKLSRQGEADIRAMFLVGGAVGVCVLLLVTAFALQSRAEAVEEAVATPETTPEVVFAAETDEVRQLRRQDAAVAAPGLARDQLAALAIVEPLAEDEVRSTADIFDETQWSAPAATCLDPSEEVLVARSTTPVTFADNLECVPSEGQWFDNYLGIEISRTIDAEVRPLVPVEVVHASGGSQWTPATRTSYLADVSDPATLLILASDTGHNPRNAGPQEWRPSNESSWCGYAVDWINVKTRWELSVSSAEAAALDEMLQTCDVAGSAGAHVNSMVIDAIEQPTIERVEDG